MGLGRHIIAVTDLAGFVKACVSSHVRMRVFALEETDSLRRRHCSLLLRMSSSIAAVFRPLRSPFSIFTVGYFPLRSFIILPTV